MRSIGIPIQASLHINGLWIQKISFQMNWRICVRRISASFLNIMI